MSQQALLDSQDTFLDTGIPPRIFFFLKNFMVWGLRLLALYRRSPAVMPAEGIRSVPRDSRHTGSSHSSKAGDRQGHGGKG